MNIGIYHGYYAIKTRRLAAFRAASQQSWHARPVAGGACIWPSPVSLPLNRGPTGQTPALFFPSRYHCVWQPGTLHPPEPVGVRREFLSLRHGPPAAAERQDPDRQLLPADAGRHRKPPNPPLPLGGLQARQFAERPVNSLCRLVALPDDKLNAIGYERILAQMSPRVGQG